MVSKVLPSARFVCHWPLFSGGRASSPLFVLSVSYRRAVCLLSLFLWLRAVLLLSVAGRFVPGVVSFRAGRFFLMVVGSVLLLLNRFIVCVMAMIVELSLWGDLASSACAADVCTQVAPSSMVADDYVSVRFPEGVPMSELIHRLGPVCASCPCLGLCDHDECGMKMFPLDMRHEPTKRGWKTYMSAREGSPL